MIDCGELYIHNCFTFRITALCYIWWCLMISDEESFCQWKCLLTTTWGIGQFVSIWSRIIIEFYKLKLAKEQFDCVHQLDFRLLLNFLGKFSDEENRNKIFSEPLSALSRQNRKFSFFILSISIFVINWSHSTENGSMMLFLLSEDKVQ